MRFICALVFSQILFSCVQTLSEKKVDCVLTRHVFTGEKEQRVEKANVTVICAGETRIDLNRKGDQSLACSNSKDHVVPVDDIEKIGFINCQMPRLTIKQDIFEVYSQLIELDVSNMGLEVLQKETFSNAFNLKRFNASHNSISDIPASLFANADKVIEVDFSYNNIKQIHRTAFRIVHMQNVNLAHNVIADDALKELSSLHNIESLDLSYNNVTQLSAKCFEGFAHLKYLSLRHSSNQTIRIEPSSFANLTDLTELDLSRNHIETINEGVFSGLTSLRKLNLQQVKVGAIEKFGFAGLNHLEDLNLSCDRSMNSFCGIGVLDKQAFENLTSLSTLNLANNPIGQLDAGALYQMEHLQRLNLSNTNLHKIENGTFIHTPLLELIDLSGNHLTTFGFEQFWIEYPRLKSLYLNDNELTELGRYSRFSVPNLQHLDITENKFNCSYLEQLITTITLSDLRHNAPVPLNPHDPNFSEVKCHFTTTSTASTIVFTTVATSFHENVTSDEDNALIATTEPSIPTKQPQNHSTDRSEATTQHMHDLYIIKIIVIVIFVLLALQALVMFILNRDKIINFARGGIFPPRNIRESRRFIADDFEVSTFTVENQ